MRKLLLALGMIGGIASPAVSQSMDEIMEVQRCVFRCAERFPAGSAEYDACVEQVCNDTSSAPPAESGAAPGIENRGIEKVTWVFRRNAVQADLGDGTIFMRCRPDYNAIEIGVSNSLFDSDQISLIFDSGSSHGVARQPGKTSVTDGDACGAIEPLEKGRVLYLVDGKIVEVQNTASGIKSTIRQGGQMASFIDPAEIPGKLNARTISLRGSSKAVAQLYKACPFVLQDKLDGCGYSD